nr:MAG TPA: helix-turn-helix domain-containing protein [Bacteriophage sp.]
MKAVLISIRPNWCKLIWSGMKTVEVRKNRPKLETPFKVYIYCTGAGNWWQRFPKTGLQQMEERVIGTFVCDEIYKIDRDSIGFNFTAPSLSLPVYTLPENNDEEGNVKREELTTCLTDAELSKYLGIYPGYGWHISDLKIWDEPVKLKNFWGMKPCRHVGDCCTCLQWDNMKKDCYKSRSRYISRPPQSWCYMEDYE